MSNLDFRDQAALTATRLSATTFLYLEQEIKKASAVGTRETDIPALSTAIDAAFEGYNFAEPCGKSILPTDDPAIAHAEISKITYADWSNAVVQLSHRIMNEALIRDVPEEEATWFYARTCAALHGMHANAPKLQR